MHRFFPLSVFILALSCSSAAVAREAPLDDSQLARACEGFVLPVSTVPERVCAAYIQGFLDGSDKAPPGAYRRPTERGDIADNPAFSERAARTRLGLDVADPPGYCVPENVSVGTVVETVAATLHEEAAADAKSAREVVSAALEVHYPCRID